MIPRHGGRGEGTRRKLGGVVAKEPYPFARSPSLGAIIIIIY